MNMYFSLSMKPLRWFAFLFLFVSVSLPQVSMGQAKVIDMTVLPGLQFSVPRFHVKPGQEVRIRFKNTDDMDHNLLIVKPGKREEVVRNALALGAEGPKYHYVPKGEDVLWHTKALHDGQSQVLNFVAPKEEGVYPYVCTLPGHGFVMYGAMYVNAAGKMPPMEKDENIPAASKKGAGHDHGHHQSHPYTLKAPYMYRTYIEGAGPAAIAVHLPNQLSYCWDAGVCRLRFAWQGEFLENTDIWKGHKDARSIILGDIFYKEDKNAVLRIGDVAREKPRFKGYKIVDGGYPEFHYVINGIEVFELIKELKNGEGVVRSFRIPELKDKVLFDYTATDATRYYFEGKELSAETLELSAQAGKKFAVELRMIK